MSLTEPQVRAGARARVLVQRHEERELPAGLAVAPREVGRLGRHADRLRGGRVRLEGQGPPGLQMRMRVEFKFQTFLNFRTFTVP